MKTHLESLQKQFSEIHPSIILKADVLRDGIKPTSIFEDIAQWAATDPHWLFEWSHDDIYHEQNVRPDKHMFPDLFELQDGTCMKIIADVDSPYEITSNEDGGQHDRFHLKREGDEVCEIFFQHQPGWYAKKTPDGELLSSIAGLKGIDTFAVCVLSHCQYFDDDIQCRYCDMNANIAAMRKMGREMKISKPVEKIAYAAKEAYREQQVRHTDVTGGAYHDRHKECEMYIRAITAIKDAIGHGGRDTLYGTCVSQAFEDEDAARLYESGIEACTWNMEVWDPKLFKITCPGKDEHVGRDHWLELLENALNYWSPGKIQSSFVSGVEMSQPEGFKNIEDAIESTTEGFEYMLTRDIVPRFNMWSNVPGSVYHKRDIPPVTYWLELGRQWNELMTTYGMHPHPTNICYRDVHKSIFPDFYHLS